MRVVSSLIVLALAAQAGFAAQLAEKKSLTLEVIKQIVAAAEKEAAANKWNMFIAIVDDGGNLVYLERMDEAQLGSGEVAPQKARSALLFKRPTKVFEDAVAGGRTAILKLPGALPIEGGIPPFHRGFGQAHEATLAESEFVEVCAATPAELDDIVRRVATLSGDPIRNQQGIGNKPQVDLAHVDGSPVRRHVPQIENLLL